MTEPSHDQIVWTLLCDYCPLPTTLLELVKRLAGSSKLKVEFVEEQERQNDLFVHRLAEVEAAWRNLNNHHHDLREHSGRYQSRNSGHAKWLDRDEWDWWTCCQVEIKRNNNYANCSSLGCKWKPDVTPQPWIQIELDRLQAESKSVKSQIVCSICICFKEYPVDVHHSGRSCSATVCQCCLHYFRLDSCQCAKYRDKWLEPSRRMKWEAAEKARTIKAAAEKAVKQQKSREERKRKRKLEPCGKFHAGLCKRGDKCSRSHNA